MNWSLPDFSLRRPITTIMLSITFFGCGIIAWYSLPLKFLPEMDEPFISVSIPYPGATPEQVEQEVAIPAEGEFRTISGLNRFRSHSDSDGCTLSMTFDLDTDMTLATADVRDRIERLKLKLPEEADRAFIHRFSSDSIPVLAVGLFTHEDLEVFAHQLRTHMEPLLRRIDGVADVGVFSPTMQKEVVVEFDQDILRGMDLDLVRIIGHLRQSSLNVSVGRLNDAGVRHFVRAMGEYRRLEDIANVVVSPDGLRLKEIATVRYAARGESGEVALDGKNGAFLMITKESEANAVTTCQGVQKELERILALPEYDGVEQRIFFNQADLITSALDNLFKEGIYGALMALVVLFIFLHRLRPTIIVALTIPTSLMCSLVFMYFSGMSLNIATMVSMIIVVGMLVDNAIVVVENTIRLRRLGLDPVESARRGASEVSLAILGSTATTWVVFVPMFFLEAGQMSVFMRELGFPLMVGLGGSLLIALTLVPLAMSRMRGSPYGFLRWFTRPGGRVVSVAAETPRLRDRLRSLQFVEATIALYEITMRWILRWRLASVSLLLLGIYATYAIPYQKMGMREMPRLDTRHVRVELELEPNLSKEQREALFDELIDAVYAMRDELGIKNVLNFQIPGRTEIGIYLYTEEDGAEWEAPTYSTQDVRNILAARLPERVPGATLRVMQTDAGQSGSQGRIRVRMQGDDTKTLLEYADQFRVLMTRMPFLEDVELDVDRSREEMQIRVDETLAAKAGITPFAIAQTVDMALRGARLPYLKQGGREIPVWAQFEEEHRQSKGNLANVGVLTNSGEIVPLDQLVKYTRERSPSAVSRTDGKTIVSVSAQLRTDDLSLAQRQLREAARDFQLPVGYNIVLGDEMRELDITVSGFSSSLFMAIILIYIVMAALFESWLLPISILTAVPLALGGAVWVVYLFHDEVDTLTFIGCILMCGVIVNNGIVIVDHINNLRKAGRSMAQAIVEGGHDRFRPVLMTALTTILGLVPMAMAKSGGAATFAGLGKALIGGMTSGTVLTLVVVPLFYSLIEDFQGWLRRFLGELRLRPPARQRAAEPAD